jgi:DNA-directed RNA polymerase specialized sigma subunit
MPIRGIGQFSKQKALPPIEYEAWKASPTAEAHAKLMSALDPIISTGLKSFAGGDNTLKTRARILADGAIQSYDPTKGASLKSHVYNNLKRLQRYKSERGRVIHIPENVRYDAQVIENFKKEYMDQYGDDPTDDTIADRLAMSRRRVEKARNIGEASLSSMTNEKGEIPGTSGKTPQQIWTDYVYHDLDDTNKKLFKWTTGYMGSEILMKKEIAKKLGITPAAISSRINTITRKLQEGAE